MRISITFLLIACIQQFTAQNSVTFQVNMNEYTGTYTNVNLNGTFNGWCGACAVMTDDDSDGIYTLEVADVPTGQIEFKFTTDGWTEQENFTPGGPCTLTTGNFTNRVATIDGDVVMDPFCWEACENCGDTPSSVDITFQVDMSEYVGSYTTVNLNGTFNGWCGGCAVMTDDDSDGVFEITTNIATGPIDYKFTIDGWDGQEELTEGLPCTTTVDGFTNRSLDVVDESTLPVVCWESCESCTPDGVEEFISLEMEIMPNPSSGDVQIILADEMMNEDGFLNVYSMTGTNVASYPIAAISSGRIDLNTLTEGIYLLEVRTDSYQSMERLLIQK